MAVDKSQARKETPTTKHRLTRYDLDRIQLATIEAGVTMNDARDLVFDKLGGCVLEEIPSSSVNQLIQQIRILGWENKEVARTRQEAEQARLREQKEREERERQVARDRAKAARAEKEQRINKAKKEAKYKRLRK
jgi:hypothetical protein